MSDGISGKRAARMSGLALAGAQTAFLAEGGERMARLVRTIEGEIVPRLLVSLGGSSVPHGRDVDAASALARLLLRCEPVRLADLVRLLYPMGPPQLDRACLRLLASAARCLRELWERNECDFDALINGLGRLESLIREVKSGSA